MGHVFSFIDDSGALVIATDNAEGIDIAGKNVLNLNENRYERDFEQALNSLDGSFAEIRFGLGEKGTTADFAKDWFFGTSIYVKGTIPEDLLLFADGESPFSVAASYEKNSVNQLRY